MHRITIIAAFILISASSNFPQQNALLYPPGGKIDFNLSQEEEEFLDTLQYYTFLYFKEQLNKSIGIVKDRTAEWAASSIAATGFAIPVYAAGAERGWITREKAAEFTLTILKFFLDSEQSNDTSATGFQGFYYHFLDMKTGKRTWNCELSTIDTGLLIAGVIFARQYFNSDTGEETTIREAADKIIKRLNWNYFTMKDKNEWQNTISMGWIPEKGFHNMGWRGYNEAIILYILAAGGNLQNPEIAYKAWIDGYDWRTPYPGLSHVVFPPLFGHQYSHMFIDFRDIKDKYMDEKGIDYFENSRRAAYTQREYSIENPLGWKGYDSLTWGLTACDGPGESFNSNGRKFLSYAGRGTSGRELTYFDDGTIAPTAAIASIVFAPEIVVPAMMNMRNVKNLWGPYGFYDSFNPTLNWVNNDYIGIDQGPIVIMIENFRSGLIWEYFMKDPLVQNGLKKLGFTKKE